MRDCVNCKVMLYTHTEPVVEACTGIEFSTMTYWYEELLPQIQACNLSPWTNKWEAIYDFTAHKTSESGVPNFTVSPELNWRMMAPLGEISEKVNKVKEFKQQVKGVQDIKDSDLDLIRLEFDEEQQIMPAFFDVGPYFNSYAQNIIKGIVPSG